MINLFGSEKITGSYITGSLSKLQEQRCIEDYIEEKNKGKESRKRAKVHRMCREPDPFCIMEVLIVIYS